MKSAMQVTWWRVRMTTVAIETRQCVIHSSATRRCQEYKNVQCFHVKAATGLHLYYWATKYKIYRTAANNRNVFIYLFILITTI